MTQATDPSQIWYCPICGGRLSYGVFCKACEAETSFAIRPATELDRLREHLRSTAPVPEVLDADF